MRASGVMLVLLLALVLAACGGNDAADSPSQGEAGVTPTVTPSGGQTLPPTWTPNPEVTAAGPPAGAGQALPPTWTPRPSPQVMFTPRPTASPFPAAPTWTPLPDWCFELTTLSAPGVSYTGHPVSLIWSSLPDVPLYRVELRHPGGGLLVSQVVSANEFTFGGDQFETVGAYGWEVTPLAENGTPICYSLSDEIVVRVPPS